MYTTKVECKCDICERVIKAEQRIKRLRRKFTVATLYDIINGFGFKKTWDICDDCLREIGIRVKESENKNGKEE